MGIGMMDVEMDVHGRVVCNNSAQGGEEDMDLRRGPWTVEEDLILVNYISNHGEGRWNSLARCAGLKRTGKSCRLRWLNYLRPDVRRGNITPEEQLLILELHSRWGNRWSKIAQHLPGRTDNEIKNYWRTRVQKHAKQLRCDVNSKQFKDVMRYLWMPRLVERIRAAAATTTTTAAATTMQHNNNNINIPTTTESMQLGTDSVRVVKLSPENSSNMAVSSCESSMVTQLSSPPPHVSDFSSDCYIVDNNFSGEEMIRPPPPPPPQPGFYLDSLPSPCLGGGYYNSAELFSEFDQAGWNAGGDLMPENLWTADDIWFLQHQL